VYILRRIKCGRCMGGFFDKDIKENKRYKADFGLKPSQERSDMPPG
jgi:hypothetical protein